MGSRQRALASVVIAVAFGTLLLAVNAAAYPSVSITPEISSGVIDGPGSVNETLTIEGTEYGGFPPPIVGITLGLPGGTTISATNHPTCAKSVLEQTGPSGCPDGSEAGPIGAADTIVSFGAERVEESVLVRSFFTPDGGVDFFLDGHSPVSLEVLAYGKVVGNVIAMEFPLVSTVPGAPYASVKDLWLRLGVTEEAEELTGLTSGVTLPLECPSGILFWATTVTFDEGGANPPQPHTTESTATTGCPSGQEPSRDKRAADALARRHAEEEAAARKKAEEEVAITRRRDEEVELATLRVLVKRLKEELHARVRLGKIGTSKHGLAVTLSTSEPGVVTIVGRGLKGRSITLVPGMHRIVVALTKAGRHELWAHERIKLSVSEKVGARTVLTSRRIRL